MSDQTTVTRVLGTLHVLEVPIPFPMKTVTITVDTSGPVTLIDAGINSPEARAGLENGLAQLNLKLADVKRVIVTHHHPDHYGMAGVLEDLGAEAFMLDQEWHYGGLYWRDWDHVWFPRLLAQMHANGLPEEMHGPQVKFHQHIRGMVSPARQVTLLSEGQRLHLAGREWEVLCLPGHADGHLGLWQPEDGLLLAADAILPRITPNIGLYAYSRPDPLADYFGTLDTLERLAPGRAIVGHHGPLMQGVAERALALRAHHHERLNFLRDAVQQRSGSAYDLSRVMFTRPLNDANMRFALAETLAHLEHLHLRGDLKRTEQSGIQIYYV